MNFLSNRDRHSNAGATDSTVLPTTNNHTTTNTTTSRSGMKGFFNGKPSKSTDYGYPADGYANRRPTVKQWLLMTWADFVIYVIVGVISLVLFKHIPYVGNRLFPITFQDGEVVYPEFSYPLTKMIILNWEVALMAILIPGGIFILAQWRIRSFWDAHNAIIGLLYSHLYATLIGMILKCLIGGLRPHFLTVCKPVIPPGTVGQGFQTLMFDRSICTGDWAEVDNGLKSFPSGHTTTAFAGFVYLSLWLNAKLKVWSNYHPAFWKMIAVWAPILGATLVGGALTIDEHHNWYDVVFGAIIGTLMALSAYRMVYASIWDYRFNHIPLMRNTPFTYGMQEDGFEDAMYTRRAGWGGDNRWGGHNAVLSSGRATNGYHGHNAGPSERSHRVQPYENV